MKNKIFFIHRILGTLLSILFVMWFLSAFVMMYHSFPKLTTKEKKVKLEVITPHLPAIDSVLTAIPAKETVKSISLDQKFGKQVFHVKAGKKTYQIDSDLNKYNLKIDRSYILQVAKLWCDFPIAKIDTLHKVDQWIPFGKLEKQMPIYKFFYNDKEHHELYISSKTGEPLQITTRESRTWAWLGAIPHWIYFYQLRQNASLWKDVVIWLSAFGCLMVLSGLWMAVDVLRRTKKKRNRYSPYRKKWYHWHYITGLIFGITVFTFCFSGMMSLAEVPNWISGEKEILNPRHQIQRIIPDYSEMNDYRELFNSCEGIQEISWKSFGDIPYYEVRTLDNILYFDSNLKPLELSKENVKNVVSKVYSGTSTQYTIHLISDFETYYRDMSKMYPKRKTLPVWKVEIDDANKTCLYVQPNNALTRFVDRGKRWKYWTYTALHRLRIPGLNSSSALRKGVLWFLLLGGTVVSISGLVLSFRYLRRKLRRRRKQF